MQLGPFLRSVKVQRWVAALILGLLAAVLGKFEHGPPKGPSGRAGDTLEGRVKLVDGDSFFLDGREVRLKGIDAPEGRQTCRRDGREWACGNAARDELRRIIGGSAVSCSVVDVDQHDRVLAYCKAGERTLNREMVATGMAVSYGDYIKEEMASRVARRGLWGSEFEKPRDWRRRNGIGG